MIVKLGNLTQINNVINEYMSKPMKISGAYKLNKIKQISDTELMFYTDEFNKIIDLYVKRDEKGNAIFADDDPTKVLIQEDKVQECNEKLNELHNIDVNFDDCYILTLDELNTSDVICTPEELQSLMPFIK